MKKIIYLFLILSTSQLLAQSDADSSAKTISVNGFIDAYYVYDFNKPNNNIRPDFLYNHTKHNEFSVNLALIQLSVNHSQYRANVGLMSGTYSQFNLAHEPSEMRSIYEAVAGLKIAPKMWVDAGIFASHLGFESAISSVNITLTRSIMAENSPYYLSGAKWSYDYSDKWFFSLILANGWQNIVETPNNTSKAIGTQVTFTPNHLFTVNWSTFNSNEQPDSASLMRYFNNFYIVYSIDKIKVIAAFDYGMEENISKSGYNNWFSPAFLAQYSVNNKMNIGFRLEHYNDKNGVIIPKSTQNGFQVSSATICLDFKTSENSTFRIEGKQYMSKDDYFIKDDKLTKSNLSLVASISINI